jgi:hypothetical protein
VELSYDSTQVKVQVLSSSVVTDGYRVMVTDKQRAYLFLKPFACREKPCGSEPTAGSSISDVLGPDRRLNVSGIVVTATGTRQLGALLRTLRSLQASLGDAGLAERVKVSPELSMSSLRVVGKDRARATKKRRWGKVLEFVRRTRSLVFVRVDTEAGANGEVVAVIEEAAAQVAAVLGADVGVVLHIKSRAVPSAAAMEKLTGRGEKRSLGVLVDVSSPRRDRELGEARATAHDEFSPVSNPATTPVSNPVTVPATNPVPNPMSPGFVTVPSTNPGNGFASNTNLPPLYPEPTTAPVTMPTPDPTTTMPPPVTVPSPFANPVAAPTTTMPGTVTNPATTPSQFPPVTNPVTTYPYPQQGGMPGTTPEVYQPPATTTPGTAQQSAPSVTGQGQAWCVAKSGLMDAALQDGIDYACGAGGADCSAIQPMGTCYNPNTLQAHASYAFNSYFQRNPSATSCDFGGAGMLVNVNPSKPPRQQGNNTHTHTHKVLSRIACSVVAHLTERSRWLLPTNLCRLGNLRVPDISRVSKTRVIHPPRSKFHLAIAHHIRHRWQVQCAMHDRVLTASMLHCNEPVQFRRRLQPGYDDGRRWRAQRLHSGDAGRRLRRSGRRGVGHHGRGLRLDGAERKQPRRQLDVRRLRQHGGAHRRLGAATLRRRRLGRPVPRLDGHLRICQGESVVWKEPASRGWKE